MARKKLSQAAIAQREVYEKQAKAARGPCAAVVKKLVAEWKKLGDTQADCGARLGVDQSTVSRTMAEKYEPSLPLLLAIREAAKVSLDELLGLAPPRSGVAWSPELEAMAARAAAMAAMAVTNERERHADRTGVRKKAPR